MGRGSPICERVRKKIVEHFKNNVPQRQIAKTLQILSSTVHNIIKRFRETGEIQWKSSGRSEDGGSEVCAPNPHLNPHPCASFLPPKVLWRCGMVVDTGQGCG